ncbi:MAG: hypothetical protein QJR05_10595 [Thermoanaerobacterium sp.]|nr:hypothetical protein [Thermoanaerobacterium sp.]
MNIVERNEIKSFLKSHLSSSLLEEEILQNIFKLLHLKGKIFNDNETYFSWGEFYAYVSSFSSNEDTCTQSVIAHAAAIELPILATDILDEISDDDQSDEVISQLSIGEAVTIANALMIESFQLILNYSKTDMHLKLSIIFRQLQNACSGPEKQIQLKRLKRYLES